MGSRNMRCLALGQSTQVFEQCRREILVGVGQGQGQSGDPVRPTDEHESPERAAAVVADQGHVLEVEVVDEGGSGVCDPSRSQVPVPVPSGGRSVCAPLWTEQLVSQ